MVNFIGIALLISLVKLLKVTEKPFLCAGLYTAAYFLLGFFLSTVFATSFIDSFIKLVFFTAIAFGLSSLYFWLLDRLDGTMIWWIIFVIGAFIGFI